MRHFSVQCFVLWGYGSLKILHNLCDCIIKSQLLCTCGTGLSWNVKYNNLFTHQKGLVLCLTFYSMVLPFMMKELLIFYSPYYLGPRRLISYPNFLKISLHYRKHGTLLERCLRVHTMFYLIRFLFKILD